MNGETPKSASSSDIVESEIQLPAVIERNERIVKQGFLKKIAKVAARVPFAEEVTAAYFCAVDRKTPARVRAVLLFALAYFVMPIDAIPDFIAALGFTDDATVLTAALSLISAYITERHHEEARAILKRLDPEHFARKYES